jgi:hypothetical protein
MSRKISQAFRDVVLETQSAVKVIANDAITKVVDLLIKPARVNGRATSSINELSRLIFERSVRDSKAVITFSQTYR